MRRVRTRQVFYIPGFDPHPARRYRELYRREGARQAEISGYRLEVEGVAQGWVARSRIDGQETEARIEVLGWSDLVREGMGQSLAATYGQLVRVVWVYVATGTLGRLALLGRAPLIAAFYPVVGLLLQAALAGLAGWATGSLVPGPPWLGWIFGGGVALALLIWARRQDHRVFVHYLMHDFAYAVRANGAYPETLEARVGQFAARIGEALAGDVDEVLVVGHSSGAQLAVSAVADVLAGGRMRAEGPALSLLTLGQAIPMQSFLPGADRLRRDLHALASEERIAWVDISAPGDGCCFALADPVAVSGVAPAEGKRWPLVLSAAFSQTLSEERLKALRHRYFRLHFQYLCAFDRPESYDYFRITAGPMTLGDRFAGRAPSARRIDRPASRHVSMAA